MGDPVYRVMCETIKSISKEEEPSQALKEEGYSCHGFLLACAKEGGYHLEIHGLKLNDLAQILYGDEDLRRAALIVASYMAIGMDKEKKHIDLNV